ncbi:hypothetical protein C8R44DRAFT_806536 [Mycena epipterygia]|nr:hypothetical protein C8R44DRAFT_806536 [Mycena epipterygia]
MGVYGDVPIGGARVLGPGYGLRMPAKHRPWRLDRGGIQNAQGCEYLNPVNLFDEPAV